MESTIAFFESPPTFFRVGLFAGILVILWILEGVIPLFAGHYRKFRHAGINMVFTATTLIIGLGLAWLLLIASDFTTNNQFGLLYLFEMPFWLHLVLGVLLLDLVGAYLIHFIEHKIRWMWKFHLIHHSDTNIDVTSGLRHHPGETLLRITFTILGVLIIGVPVAVIMIYQTFSVFFAQLTHANFNIPANVDRILSYIFVTPNMHKVHHHYNQPLTDTNYGNIFAIWDRLFGTFAHVKDTKSIKYGIDTHMDPREYENVGKLMALPFQPYRPPSGSKFADQPTKQSILKATNKTRY